MALILHVVPFIVYCHVNVPVAKGVPNEFNVIGEDLLAEIDEKRELENQKKEVYLKYILRHTKGKYSRSGLMTYSISDVIDIYNDLKNNTFFSKILRFITNN